MAIGKKETAGIEFPAGSANKRLKDKPIPFSLPELSPNQTTV
jgi:hypothetical protein